VPASAGVHAIGVIFIEEKRTTKPIHSRQGVGEIGTVGTAAATANACASTLDKLVRD
jgi:CO/xanthine dehydrogenase Mo-binding subunit